MPLSSSKRPPSSTRTALRRLPLASLKRIALGALGAAFLLGAVGGCVTVRPEEREFLADPSMTFGVDGTAQGQEEHVLGNREGSYGGGSVTGGGCGCN